MTVPEVLDQMLKLYNAKNADYGNSFEQSLDEFGDIASVVQLSHKINRLKQLIKAKAQVGESIDDTLIDLANYAVMHLAWRSTHDLSGN